MSEKIIEIGASQTGDMLLERKISVFRRFVKNMFMTVLQSMDLRGKDIN
jgi:hypothetical protein